MNRAARRTLEIAVENRADALAAARGGADRLELCAALGVGGLTPPMEEIAAVRAAIALPVLAMVRPRAGDFCYSPAELDQMRRALDNALAAGVSGVVVGVLRTDGTIDAPACTDLRARVAGRAVVFHRAFDYTPDPLAALEQLIELGFTRVLTAGGQPDATAPAGVARIAELISRAAGRIEVLPGGGIRAHNVAALLRGAPCTQVHSSCRIGQTDARLVAELRQALDQPG